jgi:hypothetical protein
MGNLIIPKKVEIRLKDNREQPARLANVIFTIHLFARRKNDFDLGPYLSDEMGVVTITEADMRHDVDATYDSGLMDYISVENCHTFMEIRLETEEHIRRALHSRETVWKTLLKGERERWGSMENLLRAYRESSNGRLNVHEGFSRLRDDWDGRQAEYKYEFQIAFRK